MPKRGSAACSGAMSCKFRTASHHPAALCSERNAFRPHQRKTVHSATVFLSSCISNTISYNPSICQPFFAACSALALLYKKRKFICFSCDGQFYRPIGPSKNVSKDVDHKIQHGIGPPAFTVKSSIRLLQPLFIIYDYIGFSCVFQG